MKIIDFVLKQFSESNCEELYPSRLSATLRGIDDLGNYGTSPCAGCVPTHDQANGEVSFLGSPFQCPLCGRGLRCGPARPCHLWRGWKQKRKSCVHRLWVRFHRL